MEQPQQVMLSAVYQVLPQWALMGNVGWQNWSAFGEFPVGISARDQHTISANLHFTDTYQLAIGQQYSFADRWLWSAGFAYDGSSVSQAERLVVIPVDRQLRYGTSLQYDINRDVTVSGSFLMPDQLHSPMTAAHWLGNCKGITRPTISTSSHSTSAGSSSEPLHKLIDSYTKEELERWKRRWGDG